jgi:hypothetical protein
VWNDANIVVACSPETTRNVQKCSVLLEQQVTLSHSSYLTFLNVYEPPHPPSGGPRVKRLLQSHICTFACVTALCRYCPVAAQFLLACGPIFRYLFTVILPVTDFNWHYPLAALWVSTSVSDPYSFDTDPDPVILGRILIRILIPPVPDPIRTRLLMIKNCKKMTAEKKGFFISKNAIYLSLGLHEASPSLIFFYFCGSFFPPGSGFGFRIRILIQSGSGSKTQQNIPLSRT